MLIPGAYRRPPPFGPRQGQTTRESGDAKPRTSREEAAAGPEARVGSWFVTARILRRIECCASCAMKTQPGFTLIGAPRRRPHHRHPRRHRPSVVPGPAEEGPGRAAKSNAETPCRRSSRASRTPSRTRAATSLGDLGAFRVPTAGGGTTAPGTGEVNVTARAASTYTARLFGKSGCTFKTTASPPWAGSSGRCPGTGRPTAARTSAPTTPGATQSSSSPAQRGGPSGPPRCVPGDRTRPSLSSLGPGPVEPGLRSAGSLPIYPLMRPARPTSEAWLRADRGPRQRRPASSSSPSPCSPGPDRAASTSLAGKGRSVAATLAEQDQERMRAAPVSALSNYHPRRAPCRLGNVNYSVTSRCGLGARHHRGYRELHERLDAGRLPEDQLDDHLQRRRDRDQAGHRLEASSPRRSACSPPTRATPAVKVVLQPQQRGRRDEREHHRRPQPRRPDQQLRLRGVRSSRRAATTCCSTRRGWVNPRRDRRRRHAGRVRERRQRRERRVRPRGEGRRPVRDRDEQRRGPVPRLGHHRQGRGRRRGGATSSGRAGRDGAGVDRRDVPVAGSTGYTSTPATAVGRTQTAIPSSTSD